MKHLTDTIREALEFFECGSYSTSKALSALTALSELERMAGEPFALLVRKNSWNEGQWECAPPNTPHYGLTWANKRMFVYATPPAQQPQAECRSDGRCQYAIDHGAEGLGHCPEGRCAMKQPQAEVAEVFYCKTCGTAMQMPHDDCLACERGESQQPQARPDFTDEWTGYLKDGETPFERFLRERKDLDALAKLYQRALEENARLKAKQPQAELMPDCGEAGHDEGCCGNRDCLPSARKKAPQQAETVPSDVVRMDWIAMHGSFGVDSVTGLPGGNGQKRIAATRAAIDTAMAQGANHG